MKIEFQLFIPFRIQRQLIEDKLPFIETFTEKFRVLINYTYHLPVAFIESLNPSEENSPSDAVVVIREFLESEFNNNESNYIQFEFLGPSPFHADCFISPSDSYSKNNVYCENQFKTIHKEGYDSIIFYYDPKKFTNIDKAEKEIFNKIQAELGFFYYIYAIRAGKINHWIKIHSLIEQLTFIQKEKDIKCFFKRIFICPKIINEAFISLIEFGSKEIFLNNDIQSSYKEIYFDKADTYFQFYVDKIMKEKQYTYPIKETNQLISFFESQRFKTIEVLTILASAILGG